MSARASKRLNKITNTPVNARPARQVRTQGTAAADVAEAVEQEAPVKEGKLFDWHRQWYPVSWEQ